MLLCIHKSIGCATQEPSLHEAGACHQEYPGYASKNCPAFPMGTFRTNYSQFLQKAVGKVDKPKQIPVAISLNGTLLEVTGFLQEGVSILLVRGVAQCCRWKSGVD
ncbi:hypothetical protein [Brevibacillus brevis]|uniref:hypothetical protein n=1 Tax=Brevibacillus brevis TaxID=1393 RepID=UPI002570BBC2|nr:hypothetical protein [Lysinibacillus sp. SDF0063]